MNSKYGSILKSRSKANMIGHINNILSFKKEVKEVDPSKLIVTHYDNLGKKIKFKKHEEINPKDQVFVHMKKSASKPGEDNKLVSAREFMRMSSASPNQEDEKGSTTPRLLDLDDNKRYSSR